MRDLQHVKTVGERLGERAAEQIVWFTEDILVSLKNIRETSLGVSDREQRIAELSKKTGISFNTLNIF